MLKFWDKLEIDRPAIAQLVGLPLLAGLVLGANQTRAGAFMPWLGSIGYWVTISFATWWLIAASTWIVSVLLRPWNPPPILVWCSGAVAGSFAARPTIYGITDLFRPLMHEPVLRAMRHWSFDVGFLTYYLTNWSLVIVMWVTACGLIAQWRKQEPHRAMVSSPKAQDVLPASPIQGFLLRLPLEIGRDILALQAEDHYVRVHTQLGNALILASLSDAISDLDRSGISGQRTHRSWWVANEAVCAHSQRGRQYVLELCNGVQVPLSLTYRQTALTGGLLPIRETA